MGGKRLLVVLSDRLSDLVRKGEITSRYYNPGNVFDDVHILMTNDDRPNPELIQRMVGSARLHLHNIDAGRSLFARSLGWQPWLLGGWAEEGVSIARQIQPDLIRAYGNYLNGFLAAKIARALVRPLVVSLHANPDEDLRGHTSVRRNWQEWLAYQRLVPLEKITLRAADWVLPVYESLREYAEKTGARRIKVCYNVLNPEHLRRKDDYALHTPARIVSVGRQVSGKLPTNLVRAVARRPGVVLTLIGDGGAHEQLRRLATECGISDRVVFQKSVSNDELCRQLPDYDVFAVHSDYPGIPKAVLEALLTGLPVVVNRRQGSPVPEFQGDWMRLVENTPEGYLGALDDLLDHHADRERLGRRAYEYSQQHWGAVQTERHLADMHRLAMTESGVR